MPICLTQEEQHARNILVRDGYAFATCVTNKLPWYIFIPREHKITQDRQDVHKELLHVYKLLISKKYGYHISFSCYAEDILTMHGDFFNIQNKETCPG